MQHAPIARSMIIWGTSSSVPPPKSSWRWRLLLLACISTRLCAGQDVHRLLLNSEERPVRTKRSQVDDRSQLKKSVSQIDVDTLYKDVTTRHINGAGKKCTHARYINVGLPKTGSGTLQCFFRCNGLTSLHYTDDDTFLSKGRKARAGLELLECEKQGAPLLGCVSKCYDAYTQLDYEGEPNNSVEYRKGVPYTCFFPQITSLESLILDNLNSTFLLPTRPSDNWYESVKSHYDMDTRISRCNLPMVGAPFENTRKRLLRFHSDVRRRTRAILKRASARHGVKWLEFDIESNKTAEFLSRHMPELRAGGNRTANDVAKCWGHNHDHSGGGASSECHFKLPIKGY